MPSLLEADKEASISLEGQQRVALEHHLQSQAAKMPIRPQLRVSVQEETAAAQNQATQGTPGISPVEVSATQLAAIA